MLGAKNILVIVRLHNPLTSYENLSGIFATEVNKMAYFTRITKREVKGGLPGR